MPWWRVSLFLSAAEYLSQLETIDEASLPRILVHGLLKVSFIREEKRFHVGWAICFVGIGGGFFAMVVISLYLI